MYLLLNLNIIYIYKYIYIYIYIYISLYFYAKHFFSLYFIISHYYYIMLERSTTGEVVDVRMKNIKKFAYFMFIKDFWRSDHKKHNNNKI